MPAELGLFGGNQEIYLRAESFGQWEATEDEVEALEFLQSLPGSLRLLNPLIYLVVQLYQNSSIRGALRQDEDSYENHLFRLSCHDRP